MDPRVMSQQENFIYMAGILDGEGSIGIEHLSPNKTRKKDYYTCRVTIINTSLELMEWLKDTFGGQFDQRKQIPGRKKCYRWHIFGTHLDILLALVTPYLLIKRKQANIVQEYRKTVGKTGWNVSNETLELRKSFWLQCKELNKIG